MRLSLSVFLILIIAFFTLSAHEYYFIPDNFILQKNADLSLHLFVGDVFTPEFEQVYQAKKTIEFNLISKNQTVDLMKLCTDSSMPVLKNKIDFNGAGLITMKRNFSTITFRTDSFLNYLHEEEIEDFHPDPVYFSTHRVRERYARFIKTLFISGKDDNDPEVWQKKIIMTLK